MLRTNNVLRSVLVSGNNVDSEAVEEMQALAASDRKLATTRPNSAAASMASGSLRMRANPDHRAQQKIRSAGD
eukprot:scaffold318937_cov32-Prasinocladus_malaysianus.AAC.1